MYDINCPYCDSHQDIDHDGSYGYGDDIYQQTCNDCNKEFGFTTEISFNYEVHKAQCMNEGDHNYSFTKTIPKLYTKMKCHDCGKIREITELEWLSLLNDMESISGLYK